MPTYETLANSSFTDVVVPFTVDNGLGVISTGTDVLTGYTLEQTKFTFTPILSALQGTYIGASLDKLIWDFGDGTYDTGFTVKKHYQYPGEYNVTTIYTDQNGNTHRNRINQKIIVYNYIPDALVWYTPTIADARGGQPETCKAGVPSNDLTLYRYNSWQSWSTVSGDGGYYINLYSQGSKSRPLTPDQYWSSVESHFVPSWRFVKSKDSVVPINRTQTDDNTYIYVKNVNGNLVRTNSTDSSALFAGTTGKTTVNYIDDNSNKLTNSSSAGTGQSSSATLKNTNQSLAEQQQFAQKHEFKNIILYASFDTSKFPVTRYDHEMSKYEILKNQYFQIYETQKIGLPISVRFNDPTQLMITSNGIHQFNINTNKYIDSPFAVNARTSGISGHAVCTDVITPLSSRWTAPTTAFSAGDITTDVLTAQGFVTMYLSGSDSSFVRVIDTITTEDDFERWDVGTILADPISSFVKILIAPYDGSIAPYPTGRYVTILFTQLDPSAQSLLLGSPLKNFIYGTGEPVRWGTRSGVEYYGYISPNSRFGTGSIKTEIIDDELPIKQYGSYSSYVNTSCEWSTISADNKYRLFAHTLIDPPLYFNYEVLYYYLTNPSNDLFHQIKPVYYRQYSYGDDGFTQTYTPPISTQTPGNSGLYGFAVEPLGDVIMVDGDTDRIIRYWRNRKERAEIDIYSILPDVSGKHWPGDEDAYGYSPSSVSLDSKLDYWVTLYDTVSTVKLSGKTNKVIAVAVPPVANYLASVRQTAPSGYWYEDSDFQAVEVNGRPGEYGENLIVPTAVETCRNDDIVVSYSNTLCSFLIRYDNEGTFQYKYEFPGEDRYFTGDMCIDVSDHVWAVTDSTGLNYDGSVDLGVLKGMIYSFDEALSCRLVIDSLVGTDFQDMRKPAPATNATINLELSLNEFWDTDSQSYSANGLYDTQLGDGVINPKYTFYEGNTYNIKNLYFNQGQHPLQFVLLTTADISANIPLTADSQDFNPNGRIWTDNVSGIGTDTISIYVSSNTPSAFMLRDANYSQNRLIIETVKKEVINSRTPESFNIINNPSYVIPDNNNNIWFSWGKRFCSRYNIDKKTIDTTVAVGSAYYEPRYHPLSADTYDRRDNADRRSAIEGLGMDTGNNLLVVNNLDKILYALHSDTPTISAFINIDHHQIPYNEFTWIDSLSNTSPTVSGDFLAPSYLTDEQINVFLANTNFTGTYEEKLSAADNFIKWNEGHLGNVAFRESHGAPEVHDVGFENEIRAGGDWTGFKWINKFDTRLVASDDTTGFVSITGMSDEFSLLPHTGAYDVFKINEDHDFAGTLREFILQPTLRDKQYFYDEFLDTVFGTNKSSPTSIGKHIYERISNYLANHHDIDVCTVDALYSMSEMVGYKLDSLNMTLPADIKRVVDMLSIKFSNLRGQLTNNQSDFEKYGNWTANTVGVNLGPELMFIYDWNPESSYSSHDFVHYNGEYYESTQTIRPGTKPIHKQLTDMWRWWPNGYVYTRHMSEIDNRYKGKSAEWREERFNNQKILIKLIQNYLVKIDKPFVLREYFSEKYTKAVPMMVNWPDHRTFKVTADPGKYTITDPNKRWGPENISDYTYIDPFFSVGDDGILNLIGQDITSNPTLTLFRNRIYRFEVDSPGYPFIITTTPTSAIAISGVNSNLEGYVGNQGVEYGTVVLETSNDPIYDDLPEYLYYQCIGNPDMGGTIKLKYVDDVSHYSSTWGGVTAYNMTISFSSHDDFDRLGWGVSFPEGDNMWKYYSMYEYIPDGNTDQEHIGNIIDWDAPGTTLSYNMSSYEEWSSDGGIMDILIERSLREGLQLFDGMSSLSNYSTGVNSYN